MAEEPDDPERRPSHDDERDDRDSDGSGANDSEEIDQADAGSDERGDTDPEGDASDSDADVASADAPDDDEVADSDDETNADEDIASDESDEENARDAPADEGAEASEEPESPSDEDAADPTPEEAPDDDGDDSDDADSDDDVSGGDSDDRSEDRDVDDDSTAEDDQDGTRDEDQDEQRADQDEPDEDQDEQDEPDEDQDEQDEDQDEQDGGYDPVEGIGVPGFGDDDSDAEGPPDDREMPLTEHIEEMFIRLGVVLVSAGLVTLVVFPWASDLIIHMWYDVHTGTVAECLETPQADGCAPPHVYGPLELVLTRIRVAMLAGLVVALPVAVYQTYRFMRPGLYPHERRYYLSAIPFSLVLGVVGILFGYFVLLPLLFEYFIFYTEGSAEIAFQLSDTMNLMLIMMGLLAVIFQIPLLIMLAIMMGITTRQWLAGHRIYFWAGFLGFGFLFGPDPTGMAPVLLAATMVALFEATLLLLKWTGR